MPKKRWKKRGGRGVVARVWADGPPTLERQSPDGRKKEKREKSSMPNAAGPTDTCKRKKGAKWGIRGSFG